MLYLGRLNVMQGLNKGHNPYSPSFGYRDNIGLGLYRLGIECEGVQIRPSKIFSRLEILCVISSHFAE